jgi:hypothetical protein
MVTITHSFTNADGTPASGIVIFKLSTEMTNGNSTITPAVPVHAMLDATGHLSQVLPANDDAATFPTGTTYTVTFVLNSGTDASSEYSVVVPSAAPGGTAELGSLLPSGIGQ